MNTAIFPKKEIPPSVLPVYYGIEEISVSPPLPKCKMFLLPKVDDDMYCNMTMWNRVEKERMPEIVHQSEWVFVSQKVKNILEDLDEIEHQFVPMSFLNRQGNSIEHLGQFYHLHIRRKLEIEPSERKRLSKANFSNISSPNLATVEDYEELQKFIEKLPIWVQGLDTKNIYLGPKVIERFRKENVVGIKEYEYKYRDQNLGCFYG